MNRCIGDYKSFLFEKLTDGHGQGRWASAFKGLKALSVFPVGNIGSIGCNKLSNEVMKGVVTGYVLITLVNWQFGIGDYEILDRMGPINVIYYYYYS